MPQGNPFGYILGRNPSQQLSLNPVTRSLLAQQLLQGSQSPQGLVSPSGVANKALQGLLMGLDARTQKREAATTQARQHALAGQLARAGQQVPQGDPAKAAEVEAAKRALLITAGGLPEDPLARALLSAQGQNVMSPGGGEPFTLSPGQTRFGANGQPVASVAPESEETALPKLVNDISDDLYKESSDFTVQLASMGRIAQSAADPSAAGDMALIYNYMKMLDPNSVVREAEYATAENARGVPSAVRNVWNRLMNGERLAEDQRGDFLNRAERIFKQASADQGVRNDRFLTRAISLGVPEQIFRPLLLPLTPTSIGSTGNSQPAPVSPPSAGGPPVRRIP